MRKSLYIRLFILVLALAGTARSYGQATCASPDPICPNPAYVFNTTSGQGLPGSLSISNPITNPAGPATNGCQITGAPNPEWMLINITSSGQLGFGFGLCGSANAQTTYLHWILWPYTATTCADIQNNLLGPVACNYNCANSGGTGMGTPPVACGANPCNFQNSIAVNVGEQYLLLMCNGTATPGVSQPISIQNIGTAGWACTTLTISSPTACPNQMTVATASWPGTSAVSYTITPPVGNPTVQTSPNFTVSSGSTTSYSVAASGTDAFGQPVIATQNFTLNINPTATINVIQPNTDYCDGSNASFTVTTGPGMYSIAGNCGGAPPSANPVISLGQVFSPLCNGVYTITATLATGCTGTFVTQINVAPYQIISGSSSGSGIVNVCQGGNINLVASMPTSNSYTWTGPNNFSAVVGPASGNIAISNAQPSVAGVYTIVANGPYNSIDCPQTSTAQLNVVQTYSVDVPPSYTLCQGVPVTLSATVDPSSSGYAWSGPGGYAGPSGVTHPILTNSILCNQAGNYVFTAYFSNQYINCPMTASSYIQVVCTNPVYVSLPALICQYSTANLLASASGAIAWEWYYPDGTTTNNMQTITIPDIQPVPYSGIYTVVATWQNGAVTCTNVGYGQMTVIPVDSIFISPPAPVCFPQSVSLYATSIGAASYTWAGPNNFSAYTSSTTVYYPPVTASGIYSVFTTYSSGGLSCYNTNTVYVSINPVMTFTLPSYIEACYNSSLTLNGPAGATSYTWSSSTGDAINLNTQNLTLSPLTPTQSGTYKLSILFGPCPSSEEVQLNVLTPIAFTLTPQSRTTCPTTSFFEVGATGGSENYAYEWNPSFGLSAPTGSYVTAQLYGSTVYEVSAHDVACPDYTISAPFTVVVNQPPVPDLQIPQTVGCDPFSVYLDSKADSSNTAIITYDFGGIYKEQGDQITYQLPGPGVYTLTVHLEGYDGCIRDYKYPDQIIVNPKANSDIQWSPEIPTSTENLVSFNAVPRSGTAAYYNWMFSGTGSTGYDTSDLKSPQRKFEDAGVFPIMLITTTNKGCVDTTIEFLSIRDELTVFIPNTFTPNNDGLNDLFQVKGLGFKAESYSLEIFDRLGHSVYYTKDASKGWDGTIKGQSPQEGIYIYRVDVIGANGEGRKEYMGHVTLLK